MSIPALPTCTPTESPFKYIRITPLCTNPWVCAGDFDPNTSQPFPGITGPCGITGTVVTPDPYSGCPRGVTCTTPTYLNQCTVINWYGLTGSAPLVDSTVSASANLLCPNALINYMLKPQEIAAQFTCCDSSLPPISYNLPCFGKNPGPPLGNCYPQLCPGVPNPCYPGPPNPPSPCTTDYPVDGICQFITQISASLCNTIQSGGYGVYNFLIKPPSFPASLDSSGCYTDPLQNPCYNPSSFFTPFQGAPTPIKGYGNYNNILFTIGACFNVPPPPGGTACGPCSQLVTLLYIGKICDNGCAPQLPPFQKYDDVDNKNFDCCTIPGSPLDTFPVFFYNYIYANVLFSITDSSGNNRRCKNKPYNSSCFLSVAPYLTLIGEEAAFCVYFGQTRNCGGLNVIVVNSRVPINCLMWGGPVYVITTPKLCYTALC